MTCDLCIGYSHYSSPRTIAALDLNLLNGHPGNITKTSSCFCLSDHSSRAASFLIIVLIAIATSSLVILSNLNTMEKSQRVGRLEEELLSCVQDTTVVSGIDDNDAAHDNDGDKLVVTTPLSNWRLFALTVSYLSISFCWGCQYARATAILQELGMAENLVSIAWIAGPISGIVVTPLIAVWSGKYNRNLGLETSNLRF